MKFGPVPVPDAAGAILAHSVQVNGKRLRKGRCLDATDIDQIASAGFERITVARLEDGDVHEDVAARRLADALLGAQPSQLGLRSSRAATGRVNLFSEVTGVAEIGVERILAVNAVDPMITIATVPEWQRMAPGGMVATIKIIPYAVPEARLALAEAAISGALRMRPAQVGSARLIQTRIGADDGSKGHLAIFKRLETLGVPVVKEIVDHEEEAIADALQKAREALLLILTGSATSDMHDTAPEGVRRAGGEVEHYGMPVDPGNLLFLASVKGKPVIGLPGCARSHALNGADWVLERLICGVPVGADDIARMGVGGLLKDIPSRPLPRAKIEDAPA